MTIIAIALALSSTVHARHAARPRATRPETLHVSSIDLTEEDGTTLTLKDASGAKLEPVRIPLAICRKDHLGRLLPGNDVDMVVTTPKSAGGAAKRSVDPARFAELCR